MPHITLVRHGQANTQARDEISYDKLSELGLQQSKWLGEQFRANGEQFHRVYTGTLRRHRETAAGLAAEQFSEVEEDPRLNEFEYFTLSRLMEDQHGLEVPSDREGFVRHMPQVLNSWVAGDIKDAPETYEAFAARVQSVMAAHWL